MKKRLNPAMLLSILFFTGCVNIQNVSDFAGNSAKTLNKYEEIPFSFSIHCQDRCLFNVIKSFSITRSHDCDCQPYEQADSISMLITMRLLAYFTTLQKISGNENATATFSPIYSALPGKSFGKTDDQGNFHGIKIEKADTDAIDSISSFVTNAFWGFYKKNKIKRFVRQANPSVQILLAKLKYIHLTNLTMELSFKKEELYAHYRELILIGGLSSYEKELIANDYYTQLNEANTKQLQIKLFSLGLDSIARGHQKMVDAQNDLNGSSNKKSLAAYSTSLINLNAAFNKLKK